MAPDQIGPNISEGSSSAPERRRAPISAAGDRISSSLAVLTLHVKPREDFASFFPVAAPLMAGLHLISKSLWKLIIL